MWFIAGTLIVVAVGTMLFFVGTSAIRVTEAEEIHPWLLWLILGLAYFILSFRFFDPVQPDQIGVRLFYGKPLDQVGPGPAFVPLLVIQLKKLPNLTVQNEWPTEPERIFRPRENESQQTPEGQKPPIRITFGSRLKAGDVTRVLGIYEEVTGVEDEHGNTVIVKFNPIAPDDGLMERVTAEVTAVTKYRIIDGINYIQTVGDEERAGKQLEDVVVGVLQKFLPLMSSGQALQNIQWLSTILETAVRTRTAGWGIKLEAPKGAFVKNIAFHRKLNEEIAKPAEAEFAARAAVRASQARRTEIINVGEGDAKAATDLARGQIVGRADGLVHLAKELQVTGHEALAAEVAKTFGQSGTATIIDSKFGIAGLAGAAASLFNRPPKGGSPPTSASS
jgi:hypothetical protein